MFGLERIRRVSSATISTSVAGASKNIGKARPFWHNGGASAAIMPLPQPASKDARLDLPPRRRSVRDQPDRTTPPPEAGGRGACERGNCWLCWFGRDGFAHHADHLVDWHI